MEQVHARWAQGEEGWTVVVEIGDPEDEMFPTDIASAPSKDEAQRLALDAIQALVDGTVALSIGFAGGVAGDSNPPWDDPILAHLPNGQVLSVGWAVADDESEANELKAEARQSLVKVVEAIQQLR